jgi:hypothetical protein
MNLYTISSKIFETINLNHDLGIILSILLRKVVEYEEYHFHVYIKL